MKNYKGLIIGLVVVVVVGLAMYFVNQEQLQGRSEPTKDTKETTRETTVSPEER